MGVHGTDDRKTAENYEVNCATNCIGTFLLTKGLLEQVNAPERVITVSSGGMYTQKLQVDTGFKEDQTFAKDATALYAVNKRQQVVFMEELSKKYCNSQFFTMHPGWAETTAVKESMPDFHRQMEGSWRSPDEGADTITYLAIADGLVSGKFWLDRKPQTTHLWGGFHGNSENKSNRDKFMANLDE